MPVPRVVPPDPASPPRRRRHRRGAAAIAVLALFAVVAVACGSDSSDSTDGAGPAGTGGAASAEATTVRLGAFPNVTHAPALAGINQGFFADALGDDVTLDVSYFNAGGEAIEALFSGALDLTFIGPNPAINGWSESNGQAVRLVAGSTSGGAFLVVREGIDSPEDLAGTTLASPALGNTQDVALRAWLADQGYETDLTGGGEVSIRPLANPDILQAFTLGELDGAWVPEPWATRLIDEAGAQILVDERDLWPNGQFVTTHLLVSTEFLEKNPGRVRDIISGLLVSIDYVNADAAEAQVTVLDAIEEISGTRLPEDVVAKAWENLEFTWNPVASSLAKSAEDATEVGLLDPVDLEGIYELGILNELLAERGDPEVSGL